MKIYRRFIERDFMRQKIKLNSEYIADDDIESILNERNDWVDLTFTFTQRGSGWKTHVYDNIQEKEIMLDDLNTVAFDWYISQIKQLIKQKLQIA